MGINLVIPSKESQEKGVNMNIEEQLVQYFKENGDAEVSFDTHLVEEHVIDSMGVIELIAFIQSTFDVELEMDDLTIDNFATINDITKFIVSKREK